MTLRLLPSSGKTDFTRFNKSTTLDFGTVSGRSIRLLEYFNDFQQPTAYIISLNWIQVSMKSHLLWTMFITVEYDGIC